MKLLFFVVIVAVVWFLFPPITVCGDSMHPTYLDGEVIFGTRLFRKSKIRTGDVVVFRSPDDKKRAVIKRVCEVKENEGSLYMYCLGDNLDESYDSRMYGYVSMDNLICKPLEQRKKKVR